MLAPAKINLDLAIVGKRADGFHLLQSLVMFADVGDEVSITPHSGLHFSCDGPFASGLPPENEKNLVVRAAKLLAASCGKNPDIQIHLTKNLPIGAGLGGGSSDAACVLKLLAQHWGCEIPAEIPAQLGSDVAACLQQAPLWIEETGDRTAPLSIPFDVPIVLVNPMLELLTARVYQAFTPPFAPEKRLPTAFENADALFEFLAHSENMLQPAASRIAPEIVRVIDEITHANSCKIARMTGSGATCFGLYDSAEDARMAAETLAKKHPTWWVRAATLRGSHG